MSRSPSPSLRRVCAIVAFALAIVLPALPATAQFGPRPTVISNVRILSMDGEAIEAGSIVIRGGRIDQVTSGAVRLRSAQVIDGTGMTATPGLVDVQSTLGLLTASWSDPIGIAFDAFDVFATRHLEEALEMGITSVYLGASGFTGVGASGSIVRLVRGEGGVIGRPLREQSAVHIDLASGARALDRLTVFDRVRAQFRAARGHGEALDRYEEELKVYLDALPEASPPEGAHAGMVRDDPPPRPRGGRRPAPPSPPAEEAPAPRRAPERAASSDGGPAKPEQPRVNPGHDVLLKAMRKELPVRVRVHRSSDIFNALELAQEFSLRIIIEGGAEASLAAGELADRKIPVVITPPPDTDLALNDLWRRYHPDSPAILAHAGVLVAMGSGEGPGQQSRFLLDRVARFLGPHGSMFNPIEMVTAVPARIMGVDREIGRLAPGMLADIVLWSGDPLDPSSRVMRTFVDGVVVFDRSRIEPVDGEEL